MFLNKYPNTLGAVPVMNPLEDFLKAMRWKDGASEAVDKIHSLLMNNNEDLSTSKDRELMIQRWKTMFQYLERKENIQLTHLSNKEDHPDWFKGNLKNPANGPCLTNTIQNSRVV